MVQNFVQLHELVGHDLLRAAQDFDLNQYNNYLILGYFVMWGAVMIYLGILANKQRNAREDLKLLTELLKEDEARLAEDEEPK
jgi:hypothetical protein